MVLSKQDIQQIANLARLDITDTEADILVDDLNPIMNRIASLSNVDTAGVEPIASVDKTNNTPLRQDSEHVGINIDNFRNNINSNAPDMEGSFFKVPKMT